MLTLNSYHPCFGDYKKEIKKNPMVIPKPPKNKISKIIVKGLFNKFDYIFEFDTDEPVAIVIAPNGAGKTTILNFINFLLCPTVENFNMIKFVPIKCFECYMKDGKIITYEQLTDQEIEENRNQIIEERFNKFHENIKKIFAVKFVDTVKQEVLNLLNKEGLIVEIGSFFNIENLNYSYTVYSKCGKQKVNFLKEFNDFCKDLDLENIDSKTFMLDVEKNIFSKLEKFRPYKITGNKRYVDLISTNRTNAKFEKDRSVQDIIRSVLELELKDYENLDTIERADKTVKIINKLSQITFLLEAKSNIANAFANSDNVLPKKVNEKVLIFEEIFRRRNKTTNKQISFVPEEGIVITQDNKPIPLTSLSSGEINDFALLYRAIFNTSSSTIMLIDEPEISLHVSWQESMVDNLIKAAKLNDTQIIIATHSPYIINNHHDLIAKREMKVYGQE